MNTFLNGFADELTKTSSKSSDDKALRGAMRSATRSAKMNSSESILDKGRKTGRNYMAATTLGAIASPALALMGRKAGRAFHNRSIRKAIKSAKPAEIRNLKKQIEKGPWVGANIPKAKPGMEPLMTASDLGGHAVHGALYGSVLNMIKDQYT